MRYVVTGARYIGPNDRPRRADIHESHTPNWLLSISNKGDTPFSVLSLLRDFSSLSSINTSVSPFARDSVEVDVG